MSKTGQRMTSPADEPMLRLRRFWNRPWQGARCRAAALSDVRWTNHRTLTDPAWFGPKMLTALVSCAAVENVETIHAAAHGPCPHTIRVIIAGVDNRTRAYRNLVTAARRDATGHRTEGNHI